MSNRINWSREELIVAFNLYCKIPFIKINDRNPAIIELGVTIGRTPAAVALKLANFARLDPELQKRGVGGLKNGSKQEEVVWSDFHGNWEELAYESEIILAGFLNEPIEKVADINTYDLPKIGKERDAIVKVRVNQNFFRKTVLASYQSRCCITGISVPELLVASHIIPWSESEENRMKPENGLCLNALHDRAFDKGLITISDDLRVIVSGKLLQDKNEQVKEHFTPYHEKAIIKPDRFIPEIPFLQYHREKFKANFQ